MNIDLDFQSHTRDIPQAMKQDADFPKLLKNNGKDKSLLQKRRRSKIADINSGSHAHAIVRSFDEATESLKTTITNAAVEINVSAFTDSIKIGDASGLTATIADMGSGIKALDVNVRDLTIDKSNDSIATESVEQSTRVDEASSTVTYFGFAAVGSSEASSVWKIKRLSVSGSVTKLEYADGNINYDNNWSNRASLSYS